MDFEPNVPHIDGEHHCIKTFFDRFINKFILSHTKPLMTSFIEQFVSFISNSDAMVYQIIPCKTKTQNLRQGFGNF